MKLKFLASFALGLAALALFAVDASAMYNPSTGTWLQRDPAPDGMAAQHRVAGNPAVGGGFVPRDPTERAYVPTRSMGMPETAYADGPNVYLYVHSGPTNHIDYAGTESVQINSVTIKRNNIQFFAVIGLKEGDGYGHWWTEIDGTESYGWWPKSPLGATIEGLLRTVTSVEGEMNGVTHFGGTASTDPHHGMPAEESFHPWRAQASVTVRELKYGQSPGTKGTQCPCATEGKIKDCISAFVRDYAATHTRWSYPIGNNCHSFQRDLMNACCLKKHKDEGLAFIFNE